MARNANQIHEKTLSANERVASFFADILGSPWTIYIFAGLSCISLPEVLTSGNIATIVSWITQTFIQLVALAILQSKAVLDGKHAQIVADETHANAEKAEQAAERILALLEPGGLSPASSVQ